MKLNSLLTISLLASGLTFAGFAQAGLELSNNTSDIKTIYPFCGPLGTQPSSAKEGLPINQGKSISLAWPLVSALVLQDKSQGICYFFKDQGKTLPLATANVNIDSGMKSGSITNVIYQDTTHIAQISAPGTNVTVNIQDK